MIRGLGVALVLALLGPGAQDPAPLRTFHINNSIACLDGAGWGTTEDKPYCTLRYVSTWWRPGDLFLLHSKRDGSGPVEFTRSGTLAAPITVRGVGNPKPVIGSFVDVVDEDFVETAVPGVFLLAGAPAGVVWATHFPDILVDDPNQSKYTMKSSDGPLQYVNAPDDATLAKVEGTKRTTLDGLRIHPFGSQKPTTANQDIVIGTGQALRFKNTVTGMIFEHLTVTYAGSPYNMEVNGTRNVLRDITWVGTPLQLRGSSHTIEHYTVTHVHFRDATGSWLWYDKGNGTAAILYGYSHKLIDGHLFHSWNNDISTESASGVQVDGVRMHGSPNHCGIAREGPNQVVRNAVAYNCQDTWWEKDVQHLTIEHSIMPGGMAWEAIDKPLGPITIRNSIVNGNFVYVRGPMQYCTWEQNSLIENSLLSASATIERCEGTTQKTYPFQDYLAQCAAGTLTGCLTVKNVQYISDWKTVLKDGMWSAALGDTWDVSLVPNSPALNLGTSTTKTDILGVVRPQGPSSDAGIYEVTADKPKPVDCVMSDWGPWVPTSDYTYANWAQTRSEGRKRSVTTPPANGGAACPTDLTETRQVVEACTTITVTPQLTITCNVAPARKQ